MSTPNDLVQSGLYDGIGNANEYTMLPGVCILPLAEDSPTDFTALQTYSPVVIARLHAPYRIRKYNFSEQKQNNPPVVQTPQDVGAFVFIGGSLSFYNQFNTTWWNSDWNVTGGYIYVENCVSRPQDGYVLGSVTPFTNDPDLANRDYYLGGTTAQQLGITIGAIAQAGSNALAGYVYGQQIAGETSTAQTGDTQTGTSQSGVSGSQLTLGLVTAWSYTSCAFYPGTLFNDQLANGGGV